MGRKSTAINHFHNLSKPPAKPEVLTMFCLYWYSIKMLDSQEWNILIKKQYYASLSYSSTGRISFLPHQTMSQQAVIVIVPQSVMQTR